MLKDSKKFVSLFLVVMLLLSLFAGCGKTQDTVDGQRDAEGKEKQEETAGEEEKVEETEQEEIYDFGGRTIRYSAWWTLEPTPGTSRGADNMIARMNEMQEKYNFTMEYLNVPNAEYVEKFTASTLAGDPFADLAWCSSRWFYPTFVRNGFLYPMSDLEQFDFSEEKWDQTSLKFFTYNGKIYGTNTGRIFIRAGIFFNKNIFEREGLPNLYELQNNYQWTWDKMLEIAKKATKDLDGDGTIDQWGLGGMGTEWSLVYSNNASVIEIDETGRPIFGLTHPNAIEALQFYQDLIQIHKVFELPPDGSAWDYPAQQFQDGKYAMFNYQVWITDRYAPNMADDYGFVAFPMGPKANEYTSEMWDTNCVVMPSAVKKPEEVAVVWDKMTDPYPDDDPESWRESYEARFRDEESIETVKMLQDKQLSRMNYIGNFRAVEELSWSFMWQIRTGNKTPQVAIEEIAAQAQALLDDAIGGE